MTLSKDWEKRLEAIGNTPMDDTSKRIMAGIEASKKRNAELAKDVDKRRAEYEANKKASSEAKQKASSEAKQRASKKSPIASATTVRQHKGGGATAEVDTERVARQKAIENMVKKEPQTKPASSDEGTITPQKTAIKASVEERTEKPAKKRISYYNGGPEWRQAIKRTLTAPLRLVARAAEKQEKKKKGSRYGSPYQLRVR